jgi:chromosome segregation ATPase
MSDDKRNNRRQLIHLLEVYSMEEISELFSKIDKNIISLHEYSSEDFLNLNNDFKTYYKVANKISDNAAYLFEFLADQKSHYLPTNIEELYKQLNARNKLLENQIEVSNDIINRLLSQIRQAFFPIKNFKQNLTSLRFLETNLELDSDADTGLEPQVIGDICSKTKDQLVHVEKSFQKLKMLIKTNFTDKKGLYSQEINIKNILENLESELNFYRDHFEKASNKIPEIKEKTDQTKESISKIITNLQYHDIIKQKMEHIQKTHKDLVSELDKINNQDDISDLDKQAKYFIRVRDIAGLQAAQLMHTNKEYQTAIQRISDKFLEIGENMSYVANQCTEYTSFDIERKKIFFDSLKNNLGHAKSKIKRFCEFNNNFNRNIEKINQILHHVLKFNEHVTLLLEDIKKFISLIKERYNGAEGKGEEKILNQITQLYNDLESNKKNLDGIFENIEKIKDTLEKNVLDELNQEHFKEGTGELPEKIEEYINELNGVEETILEKLTENNELSEGILSDIQKTVSNIKYYDYFEDIIETIINELNTINYKLRFEEDEVRDKEENLKKLTEYYTMNSEFVIHDQVTQGSESDIEVSEDGGDLELF